MSPAFDESSTQFLIFKDCLARRLLSYPAFASQNDPTDADELDDFTTFLASETWSALPEALRQLSPDSADAGYTADVNDLINTSVDLIPPNVLETLTTYVAPSPPSVPSSSPIKPSKSSKKPSKASTKPPPAFSAPSLLEDVLTEYASEARAPDMSTADSDLPPNGVPKGGWKSTRADECEICEREVHLTYHHLIPRAVHDKVLKRGWHSEEQLNSVAWLCRHCHSFVHRVATHEELAREFYTVEMLLEREDVQKWRAYASRQRWGVRPKKNPTSSFARQVLSQGG